MAPRKNKDAIRELEVTVARLTKSVDHLEQGVNRGDAVRIEMAKSVAADVKQTAEAVAAVTTRLAVIEQRFDDLKQSVEQREQKRWAVALIVISALAGGVTSVLFQKLLP